MGKLKNIASSYKTTIILLILYTVILAASTIIEKYYGTSTIKMAIYHSPFFIFFQFLLIVNFVAVFLQKRLFEKKKWGFVLIHFSLIVILCGAFVSHVFGDEGIVHIREGESSNRMLKEEKQGIAYTTLPFSIELVKFNVERYPGSPSPSSFESRLIIHDNGNISEKSISMNNVLDIDGYRFFQSSYDKDEKGTVLSVNKDVAGRNITYTGYFFLLTGFLLSFVEKNSRFRQLNRMFCNIKKTTGLAVFFSIVSVSSTVEAVNNKYDNALSYIETNTIPPEHAAKFGALPMLSHKGRVEPVNTFSSELLRKLHKSETFGTMNSDQFLLSLLVFPDVWMHVPFIHYSNPDLTAYYDLTMGEYAYAEVFDEKGNYKFIQKLQEAYAKSPSTQSRFDKDLLKVDEQVNIFYQLVNYRMLNIFPKANDGDCRWYAPGDDLSGFSGRDSLFVSYIMPYYIGEVRNAITTGDWSKADAALNSIYDYQMEKEKAGIADISSEKIRAELLFNELNIFRACKIAYFVLGGLLLLFSFVQFMNARRWIHRVIRILIVIIMVPFLYHLSGIILRGYIAGYAPWSNSYETLVYVAWITVLAGLFFVRKSPLTFALATLFGGIILFVSGLSWMDPQISPLVPVLKSPWLTFHVAVIVAAYGFFGVCCLIGLTNLIIISFINSKRNRLTVRLKELTIINEMSMYIGLALMSIGTFLGAIWANEAWGRYWGWDPKETWALVTMIVYAVNLHLRLVKKWDNPWLFNLVSVMSIASVLMTYFGVNYFLSGMHSYGQNGSLNGISIYLFTAVVVVLVIGVFSRKSYYKYRKEKDY